MCCLYTDYLSLLSNTLFWCSGVREDCAREHCVRSCVWCLSVRVFGTRPSVRNPGPVFETRASQMQRRGCVRAVFGFCVGERSARVCLNNLCSKCVQNLCSEHQCSGVFECSGCVRVFGL